MPDKSESLWVGGMHMHNVPMALVRECIRQGKRFETFYAGPSSSLAAELLIGSGPVERVIVGYIGFEHIGLAPLFRRVVESGDSKIEFIEADSGQYDFRACKRGHGAAFRCAARGAWRQTDLPDASPALLPERHQSI